MIIEEESVAAKKTGNGTISAEKTTEDVAENQLRPKDLDNYIGQTQVKENLRVFATASKNRGDFLDHTLLYGPPGLGKTTLSLILARMMNAPLRQTSGPALEKPGDLAAILTGLKEGDFLFIDEIHRLRRPVEEILYTAMEDFAIDLIIGKGPAARTMRLNVPRFTLVGATTQASLLTGPLRDRFGHTERLRFYEHNEIGQIIVQSAKILDIEIEEKAAEILGKCSRRTPRIANRLLKRMRDFAEVKHAGVITKKVVEESLKELHIDPLGLNFSDQQYLQMLANYFAGGPVGVSTLASATGEEIPTVEEVIEPFLIREGLLMKTSRGRVLTQTGWEHLGMQNPKREEKQKNSLF